MSRPAIHAFVRIAVLSFPFALLAPAVARAAPPALDVLETQLRGGRCPVAERPGELCGERTLSARLRDWALDRERVTYECVRAAAPCLASLGSSAQPALPALLDALAREPRAANAHDGALARGRWPASRPCSRDARSPCTGTASRAGRMRRRAASTRSSRPCARSRPSRRATHPRSSHGSRATRASPPPCAR